MENHQFELLEKKSGYHFQNPHLLKQTMFFLFRRHAFPPFSKKSQKEPPQLFTTALLHFLFTADFLLSRHPAVSASLR